MCIEHERNALIPNGYQAYPFRRNTPESKLDMMRSIVATYIYRKKVQEFRQDGVDFSMYLYVPEKDTTTGEVHHERADHGHLLKRIAGN